MLSSQNRPTGTSKGSSSGDGQGRGPGCPGYPQEGREDEWSPSVPGDTRCTLGTEQIQGALTLDFVHTMAAKPQISLSARN